MMRFIFIALAALPFASQAGASPCKAKIDELQARFNAARPAPGVAPVGGATAAETTAARLHHQPNAASAADAGTAADSSQTLRDARIRNELFNAQAAEDSGDVAGCEAAVAAAAKEMR